MQFDPRIRLNNADWQIITANGEYSNEDDEIDLEIFKRIMNIQVVSALLLTAQM